MSRWQYEEPQPKHAPLVLRKDLSLDYLEAEEQRQIAAAAEIKEAFVRDFKE